MKEICTFSLAAPETYCWHFKVLDARKGLIQEINFNSKIRLLIIWKTILRKFVTNIRSLFIFLGVEVITVVCVRDDDQSAVGDQFCEEKRPEDITKECNTQACPARWDHKRLISVWRLGVIWLKYYWYWTHTNRARAPRGGLLAQGPVHTKTTGGQYSPARLQQARLVSSLLNGTRKRKQYTAYYHFHGNCPYSKIPGLTKK